MKLEGKNPPSPMFIPTIGHPYLGADPEFFVLDGPKLLPAFEFLPDKQHPIEGGRNKYTQHYWDGFQAEFSLKDSHHCLCVLAHKLQEGVLALGKVAAEKYPNAKISLKSVVRIPTKTLQTAFDPYVELGCAPSYNAYDLKGERVDNPRELKYRFAGGHMHFGIPIELDRFPKIVKALDAILGVWSVGAAQNFDNPIRRKYYGLAGEYRTPAHGLEYRTLSNFWLSHPIVMHAAWEIGRRAYLLQRSGDFERFWVAPQEMVIECIQNSDVQIARQLLTINKPIFQWMLGSRMFHASTIQRMFEVGLNGIETLIKEPDEVLKNWIGPGHIISGGAVCDNHFTIDGFIRANPEGAKA